MKWVETKVVFEAANIDTAVELISNVFYDLGAKGVVIEDSQIEPADGFWDDTPIVGQHNAVSAYFPSDDETDAQHTALIASLGDLHKTEGIRYRLLCTDVDEEDWENSWKTYFHVQKISERIVIKPTWQDYDAAGGEIVLELDPGMAFGTGTHATTTMCIRLIEKYLEPDDSFLDVGTGSGILSIAAAKLGAKTICAVDSDRVAIDIARNNLHRNHIDNHRFTLIAGNLVDRVQQSFDIVCANILSDVILVLLDDIKTVLSPEGTFICSGIVEKNKTAVIEKMTELGFDMLDVITTEDWVAIAGRRKK